MKTSFSALACVAQWFELWPATQRVTGLIPSQGHCLGYGPGQVPHRGRLTGNHTLMFLSPNLSLPSPLSKINKQNLFSKSAVFTFNRLEISQPAKTFKCQKLKRKGE